MSGSPSSDYGSPSSILDPAPASEDPPPDISPANPPSDPPSSSQEPTAVEIPPPAPEPTPSTPPPDSPPPIPSPLPDDYQPPPPVSPPASIPISPIISPPVLFSPPLSSPPPSGLTGPPPPPPSSSSNSSSLSPPVSYSPPPPPPSNSLPSGLIIAISAGGAIAVLLLLSLVCCFCFASSKRRKSSHQPQNDMGESGSVAHPNISSKGTTPLVGSGTVTPTFKGETKAPNTPPAPNNISPAATNVFGAPTPQPSQPPSTPPSNEMKPYAVSTGSAASAPMSIAAFASSQSTQFLFSYDDLEVATEGFSPQNLLGEGGFGKVYKGVLTDGRVIAVKGLNLEGGQGEREFRAEVETISRVHHKHLVTLLGCCVANDHRLLVYEFIPNGTLDYNLHNKNKEVMPWSMRMRVGLGAAKGLAYLHEDCNPRIFHRDIKSANILIDKQFEAKVADFGLAKFANDAHTHVTTRVMGTFGYLAPEYAMSGKLNEKSDVYSFGVVLLELITGRKPVDTSQPPGLESLVEWARPLLLRDQIEELIDARLAGAFNIDELRRMLKAASLCVRHSAVKRPKMSQVVRILEGSGDVEEMGHGADKPGVSAQYDVFSVNPSADDYDSVEFSNNFWQKFSPNNALNGNPNLSSSEPNSLNFSENIPTGSGLAYNSTQGGGSTVVNQPNSAEYGPTSSNFSSGEYIQGPYSGPLFSGMASTPSPESRFGVMPSRGANRPVHSENSMGFLPEDSEVQGGEVNSKSQTFSGLQENEIQSMLASSALSDRLREGR